MIIIFILTSAYIATCPTSPALVDALGRAREGINNRQKENGCNGGNKIWTDYPNKDNNEWRDHQTTQ